MRALGVLLGLGGDLQPGLFRPPRFEIVVAAGIEIELALAQMQDGVDRIVEQLAVVADDQGGIRIFLQPRFEPQRAFEIEIVGRLVEQQKLGLGEQSRRERHAHAPAAGKFRHRPRQIVVGETEAAQDFRGAGGRAIGIDGVQALIDFGKLFGFGGLQLRVERLALRVGREHRIDQRHRRCRMLLIDRADPRAFGQHDLAALRRELAQNELEQGGFADAVAADQTDFGADRNRDARFIEEAAAPGIENEIIDPKHFPGPNTDELVGR